MMARKHSQILRIIPLLIAICLLSLPAHAKYSGGSGTAQDPYQIGTAADLILLGETPADYGKHFILTADIDLDPKLPGRKVFDRAVVAPDTDPTKGGFQGTPFSGIFDGNGHTISHLTIKGKDFLGLFGQLGSGAQVKNLGVVGVNIIGSGSYVGGLVGYNVGLTVTHCYSTGTISGAGDFVGGLAGFNEYGGDVTDCYSTSTVSGENNVGGLVGTNGGSLAYCYSTGAVSGMSSVGGLVGSDGGPWDYDDVVTACFWDTQTSGQATSAGGTGKATAEMQRASTFLGWGASGPLWTIDEGKDYPHLAWEKAAGQIVAGPAYGGGTGTPDAPYLIYTAEHLNSIGLAPSHWDKYFQLMADIDLAAFDGKDGRPAFNIIAPGEERSDCDWGSRPQGIPFAGVFDGNGHSIPNFTYASTDAANTCIGLFGIVGGPTARIKDLRLIGPNVTQGSVTRGTVGCLVGWLKNGTISGCCVQGGNVRGVRSVGGVVGSNGYWHGRSGSSGTISNSYASVSVNGKNYVGGLVGENRVGTVNQCYSTGAVIATGEYGSVGGLVGNNDGAVTNCYSTGAVSGREEVGGLVGGNASTVTNCYSTSTVSGENNVGGLVGTNGGSLAYCYSTGAVSGMSSVGGLVGIYWGGTVTASFWDTQTSEPVKKLPLAH